MTESTGEFRACPGCGARFERRPWALDRDLRASPECWRAYCEVERFARDQRADAVRQLAADAYHAQHAGAPTPPAEVARGLAGLYLVLERDAPGDVLRRVRERLAGPHGAGAEFTPPSPSGASGASGSSGPVTVEAVLRDGVASGSAEEFRAAVQGWATSVWQWWAPHHADVAALVEDGDAGRG